MKARLSYCRLLLGMVLFVVRLMMLGLPVLLLVSLLAGSAFADGGTVPPVPNILNMTLPDFLMWIVSDAVLGALVALLLIHFNVPEAARPIIMAAALGGASWLVRTLLPFIPPELLGKTVWEVLFILLGTIPAWLGLKLAALQHVGMLRAAEGQSRTLSNGHYRRLERSLKLAGMA